MAERTERTVVRPRPAPLRGVDCCGLKWGSIYAATPYFIVFMLLGARRGGGPELIRADLELRAARYGVDSRTSALDMLVGSWQSIE